MLFGRYFLRRKYSIIDDPDDSKRSLIEFIRGKYTGIVIRLGAVRLASEPNEIGQLGVSFAFDVMRSPTHWYIDLQKDADFRVFMVSVVEDLLVQETTGKLLGRELNFHETMDELY